MVLLPFDRERLVFTLPEIATARRRAAELGLNAEAPGNAGAGRPGDTAERWLTSKQLAEITGVGDVWWEQAAKSGRVPSIRAGKALRFRLSEVAGFLRSRHADPGSGTPLQWAP